MARKHSVFMPYKLDNSLGAVIIDSLLASWSFLVLFALTNTWTLGFCTDTCSLHRVKSTDADHFLLLRRQSLIIEVLLYAPLVVFVADDGEKVVDASTEITAFAILYEVYQFEVMSPGLIIARCTFLRMASVDVEYFLFVRVIIYDVFKFFISMQKYPRHVRKLFK